MYTTKQLYNHSFSLSIYPLKDLVYRIYIYLFTIYEKQNFCVEHKYEHSEQVAQQINEHKQKPHIHIFEMYEVCNFKSKLILIFVLLLQILNVAYLHPNNAHIIQVRLYYTMMLNAICYEYNQHNRSYKTYTI